MSDEMAKLTGAYAVDALERAEREEFERHLAQCEECAEEVRELRETAARLGAGAATAAPDGLRQRVLDEIARTRQDPPATGKPASLGAHRARRRGSRSWTTRLAVAAAVVGLALAGAAGVVALNTQQELDDLQARVTQQDDRQAELTQVLQAGDARLVTASNDGARSTVVISRDLGKTVLLGTGLPALPDDRVYQAWFIGTSGAAHSAGLLPRHDDGTTTPIVANMPANTEAIGVTSEPAGGSEQPTTEPIMGMELT